MPNFRRGAEHIAKAVESAGSGGGNYKPFLPRIYWNEDGQEKCVLILNALDEIPMVQVQQPWTTEGRKELVVARTDEAIGESKDPLEQQWGYAAADNNICIAVELETEFTMKKGRKRPTGFTVKTRTFKRSPRDDKGEVIEGAEKEEVTVPCIGFIAQSPNNFFNHIASKDANTAPINETPVLIRRLGDDKNTDYEVEMFDDLELDLTDLFELIENVNWLGDDLDALLEALAGIETEEECVALIGGVLLDRLLNERADREYYDAVFALVDKPARYPKKGWKGSGSSSSEDEPKVERSNRTSQRRSKREADPEAEANAAAKDPTPEGEPDTAEEAPKPKRRTSRATKAEETQAEEPKREAVSKSSPVAERLAALQAKAAAAKAASAA